MPRRTGHGQAGEGHSAPLLLSWLFRQGKELEDGAEKIRRDSGESRSLLIDNSGVR